MPPTALSAFGRAVLLCWLVSWLSPAAFASPPPSNSVFTVYDRYGDEYDMDELLVHNNSQVAGIFRLHFVDQANSTTTGFDGGLGAQRRALLTKVFEDITAMVGGFTQDPYTGISPNCTGTTPFPDCRLIEIEVRESPTTGSPNFDGRGSAYYKTVEMAEINSGAIWQYINTGWDPFHLWPYNTEALPAPFSGPIFSSAYGNHGFYHGWMEFDFSGSTSWNESLTAQPGSGQMDMYTVALREALLMLGLSSNIYASGNSIFGWQSPGIYSHWDLHLQTNGTSLINFDLDAGDCWNAAFEPSTGGALFTACTSVVFNGPAISNHPVYTSNSWTPEVSLSRFNCTNQPGWVMNPTTPTGFVQRFPSPTEYRALCAIGYELTGTYGRPGSGVVLHPTSYSGVTHSSNNEVVSYGITSCPQTHEIAATDDFGPYTQDANYQGVQMWNNSGNYRVAQNGSIDIFVADLLLNDYNAVGLACQPQIVAGGGTVSTNLAGTIVTYDPDANFTGTAVLRYRAQNALGERSNTAYIYIGVGELECELTGVCGENLVCQGDFEDIDQCEYRVGDLGMYGAFAPAGWTGGPNNDPDLQPGACADVCGSNQFTQQCGAGAVHWCGTTDFALPDPLGAPFNTQFAAIYGANFLAEEITLPLKRPLQGSCHEIRFDFATTCDLDVMFVFSEGPPCWHQTPFPTPGTIPCSAGGGPSSYTVLHIEPVMVSGSPAVWDGQNNIPVWDQANKTINSPNLANAEFVSIYVQAVPGSPFLNQLGLLIDNIEITDCGQPQVEFEQVMVSTNSPCPGDVVTIDYTIRNAGATSFTSDVMLEAVLAGTSAQLPVIANQHFTSQGTGTIPASSNAQWWPNTTRDITLEIQVPTNATPGVDYCVDLIFPGGPCIVGQAQQDCFTIGSETITLEKNVISDGPYHPGSFIEYQIKVENLSGDDALGIVIEDILPSGLTYVSSTGNWASNGTTNTSNAFNVLANGGLETFTIRALISPSFGCGSIENCASVIAGHPYCGPLVACAPVTVTLSGPPIYSAISVNHVTCNGGCDGSVTVGPTGANIWFHVVNPPPCYGPPQSVPGPVIGNLSAGTYTIEVNDLNTNCTEQFQVTITEPPALVAGGIFTPPTCIGACDGSIQVMVNGGVAPYNYLFGGGSVGATISNLCGNFSYVVDVIDANGCSAQVSGTLWDPQPITATLNAIDVTCGNLCDGELQATLSGGAGGFTWSLFLNGSGPAFQTGSGGSIMVPGLCTGNHLLQITDANGCQQDHFFNVDGPDPIVVNFTGTDETCIGNNDGTITLNVNGGSGNLAFAWSGPGGFTSNTQNLTGLVPGTYCVTVTDDIGCTNVQPDCFVVGSPVAVTGSGFVSTPITCNGACDGVIDLSGAGGTGNYVFTINGPGIPPPGLGVNGNQWTAACHGTYTIVVSDDFGCTDEFQVSVVEPPLLVINGTGHTPNLCAGDCNATAYLLMSGGVPPYGFGTSANGPWTANAVPNLCGNQTIDIFVRDAQGCVMMSPVTIPPDPDPLVYDVFQFTDETCVNACDGEINVVADGGTPPYTYTLNGGQPQINNGFYDNLCAGNYSIGVTDANGCTFGMSNTIQAGTDHPWPKFGEPTINTDAGRAEALVHNEGDGLYYVTGSFEGDITFEHQDVAENITLTSVGGTDAFVAMYDECGVVWAYGYGSAANDRGLDMHEYSANGRIFVVGSSRLPMTGYDGSGNTILSGSSVNGVPYNSTTNRRGFVMQLDPLTGNPDWVWIADMAAANQASEVTAVDEQLNGAIVGIDYAGTINLGGGATIPTASGGVDIAIVTLDGSGSVIGSDAFGSVQDDHVAAIDDWSDNSSISQAAITGYLGDPNYVWSGIPASYDMNFGVEAFAATYISSGPVTPVAMYPFGGQGADRGEDIVAKTRLPGALTPGIYVTGSYTQFLEFPGQFGFIHTPVPHGQQAFVAGMDWSLIRKWSKVGGGPGNQDAGLAIEELANGNVMAAGYMAGISVMASPPNMLSGFMSTGSATEEEMWIIEFDAATGTELNAFPNGTDHGDGTFNRIHDIGVGTSYIYTCGAFGGFNGAVYDFVGPLEVCNSNNQEMYFARLDYSGNYQPRVAAGPSVSPFGHEHNLINIFPNPTNGEFTVQWSHDQVESLEVLDLSGRLIHRTNQLEGRTSMTFNLHEHAQGVYLIRLVTDQGVETRRLVRE